MSRGATLSLGLLLVVVALPGPAASSDPVPAGAEHPYVGPTPVLIPAGHAGGISLLGARDAFWWNPDAGLYQHVGGLICQVPPGADPCPPLPPQDANDPSYRVFCGGITLQSGFWSPSLDTYVWVGYDRLGATGPHGHGVWCEQPRPPTVGYVWHWPV